MKQINHHLTDSLLMGYAAGSLPEAFNLVVATHISMCDSCRAALAAFEAVGGEVLGQGDAAEMAEDSLAATLARLDGPVAAVDDRPAPAKPRTASGSDFPEPLQSYVNGEMGKVRWRKIGGGVSQMILPTSSSASVRLLRIPGGAMVPDHGHRGLELTLVLQGAFHDEADRFAAGDIEVANEDLTHTPVAEVGQDCICLSATDAPLRFSGILPRLAQRFAGI